jgi:hypothetical protein
MLSLFFHSPLAPVGVLQGASLLLQFVRVSARQESSLSNLNALGPLGPPENPRHCMAANSSNSCVSSGELASSGAVGLAPHETTSTAAIPKRKAI